MRGLVKINNLIRNNPTRIINQVKWKNPIKRIIDQVKRRTGKKKPQGKKKKPGKKQRPGKKKRHGRIAGSRNRGERRNITNRFLRENEKSLAATASATR